MGQAAPVGHDGETLERTNLVAGLEEPEAASAVPRLVVAWEERVNGRVVDAYPTDRTGAQAPLWSLAQYRERFPMVAESTLQAAFHEQFLDVNALYGTSGNEPLMDLSGIQPGDEGQLDLFVQPLGSAGIVGVTGRLLPATTQQPQSTGSQPATAEAGTDTDPATTATTPLADAVTATLVQTGHNGDGKMATVVLADGTLREVVAAVSGRPVPLDGDLSTDGVDCTTDRSVPHVRLTWELPETATVVADDAVRFDLRFTAAACPSEPRPSLSVTTRSYADTNDRDLVYIVRVRNDGPATATNVRVVPTRDPTPASQRTTIAGYGNCLVDQYDWLNVKAIRVRKGPTVDMLTDFSRGDAGGGRTYDETFDPTTGVWYLGTVKPNQTWELLVSLDARPCSAGETFRNTVTVQTDEWWGNRRRDPGAWTATTETRLR